MVNTASIYRMDGSGGICAIALDPCRLRENGKGPNTGNFGKRMKASQGRQQIRWMC